VLLEVVPQQWGHALARNSQRCWVKALGDEMQDCYQWVAGEWGKRWLSIRFARWQHMLITYQGNICRELKIGLHNMSVNQMGSAMLCLLDQPGITDHWFNTCPKTGGGLHGWRRGLTMTATDLAFNKRDCQIV